MQNSTQETGNNNAHSNVIINKVVIIGDSNVGKTCIIQRFIEDKFGVTQPTIGASHTIKTVYDVQLDIWDTAGQERFKSMVPMYYRGAKAILITFDVTNQQTFDDAKKWMFEIDSCIATTIIVLIANKIDLPDKRVISYEVAKGYADEKNIFYFETSAKEEVNIKEAFAFVANKIREMNIQGEKGIEIKEIPEEKSQNQGWSCKGCK